MNKKETIYIDVDDDITSIIDRVKSSSASIVALVLPKRASVLQSSVNMKLLRRASDQSKKKPVLITSEHALMPLAGAAGVHTAPNLQSKPEIPQVPDEEPSAPAEASESEVELDPATPVGEAMGEEKTSDKPKETAKDTKPSSSTGGKSGKSPKVPNFKKFRKWIIIGGIALALLIAFLVWAIFFAAKAQVTLQTETSDLPKTIEFTADTEADSLDLENSTLPAQRSQSESSESERVPATGQEDKGKKASGQVELTNCNSGSGQTRIPSGTGVSSGGLTYLTQGNVTLPPDVFVGGVCQTESRTVGVEAQDSGERYNVGSRSYSVNGYEGVVAEGSKMTGGSTNLVKVVSEDDINNAKELLEAKQEDASGELEESLREEGFIPLRETLDTNTNFTPNPKAGKEANEVTVNGETTYSMLGVNEDDLKELIEESAIDDENIDEETQSVLDFGLEDASFEIVSTEESGVTISMQTTLAIGPQLDEEQIKSDIADKKTGEAENILNDRPGFSNPVIETSPFWVSSVPGNTEKIELTIQDPDGSELEE